MFFPQKDSIRLSNFVAAFCSKVIWGTKRALGRLGRSKQGNILISFLLLGDIIIVTLLLFLFQIALRAKQKKKAGPHSGE